MGPDADFDALAAPPDIALAGEFRMEGELEVGQAIERDAGQHELFAGGLHQLRCVDDAIGFGDEPAGHRVAVDALGDVVVHAAHHTLTARPRR
jgi:hypothetical protein